MDQRVAGWDYAYWIAVVGRNRLDSIDINDACRSFLEHLYNPVVVVDMQGGLLDNGANTGANRESRNGLVKQ